MTANRYVAFIDIMGFKDMVATLPHNDIYSMMKRVNASKKLAENISWDDKNLDLIRTTTYSDSIMLYTKDETYESLDFMISAVSSLTYDLFNEKIPHKGGIAHGLMTLDTENSIFFGQPLIDAYLLQEELHFYGVILHATCERQIESVFKKKPPFVTNYLCPLKNGSSNHLTIYPMYTKSSGNAEWIKMTESIKNLRFRTSGHLRRYIDNTELYLTKIREAK